MVKEYTNNDVFDFLTEECQHMPELWEMYGTCMNSHKSDAIFWKSLSERLDCFRICDECGKPMIEGYVVDGCDTYCSKECLYKHFTEEEFNDLFNNGSSDTYWTTWYEDSITYRKALISN